MGRSKVWVLVTVSLLPYFWRSIIAYRADQLDSIRTIPRLSLLGPSLVPFLNKTGTSRHSHAVQGVEAIVVSPVIAAFEL